MTHHAPVRPRSQLAPPKVLTEAFDDPDDVIALIRKGAPYKTQEAAHKHPGVEQTGGWFRNFWALGGKVIFDGAARHFHNERFIAAARESFGAEVVRPVAMMTNLNLPMDGLPPHLDLPFFRGAMNRELPAWMLAPMGYSGLFHDWAVPVASVVTWFYEGEGGEFEYWPDGPDAPSFTERVPMWNRGVLADNEYMWHRVGATGRPADYVPHDAIPYDARLALAGDGWEVRDGERRLNAWAFGDVRLSVLWKAYCFRTGAEAAAFDDRSDDLTPARVREIFSADLRGRGEPFDPTADFDNPGWKATLERVYAPSLTV